MWWNKKTAIIATNANAPVFNPNSQEQQEYALYRADAIARNLEQRNREIQGKHPEHDALIAEAMSYAWLVVKSGTWNIKQLKDFEKRLGL